MSGILLSRVPDEYSRNPERIEIHEELMSGANVHVAGIMGDGMGGLKESQGKFRKHHQEVGDALNNLADGVDKDEPRPGYTFKQFPMMIYHADGREQIVDDVGELKQYQAAGFRREPYPKPKVMVSTPEMEKKALMDQLASSQGQITTRDDLIAKMNARLEALEAAQQQVPLVDDLETAIQQSTQPKVINQKKQ